MGIIIQAYEKDPLDVNGLKVGISVVHVEDYERVLAEARLHKMNLGAAMQYVIDKYGEVDNPNEKSKKQLKEKFLAEFKAELEEPEKID